MDVKYDTSKYIRQKTKSLTLLQLFLYIVQILHVFSVSEDPQFNGTNQPITLAGWSVFNDYRVKTDKFRTNKQCNVIKIQTSTPQAVKLSWLENAYLSPLSSVGNYDSKVK